MLGNMFISRLYNDKKGLEKISLELQEVFKTFYPESNAGDYTSMVNDHHHLRMHEYLQDAKEKGKSYQFRRI